MRKQIILLFTLFTILLFTSFTVLPVSAQKQPAQLLKELDDVIANKEIYREKKEALLDSLKALTTRAHADEQLYPVYENLCAEYFNYNVDSAFVYTLHKYELAQKINKPQLIIKSKIDLAHLYMLSGAYMAGLDMLQTISRQTIVEEYLPVYYHIYKTSYEAMAQECPLLQQKKAYMAMSALYRDSLRMQLQANDITLLFVTTEELTEKGACREALEVLLNKYGDEKTSTHEKAIVAYSIARAYRGLQHTDSAICYFAASAINDFKTPVKEYRALQTLALILYEEGDINRAYNYINVSINDALEANTRMNIPFISTVIPVISQAYQKEMKEKDRLQIKLIWFISVLLLALVAAIIIVYAQKKKVTIAERNQYLTNIQLAELNNKLMNINAKLVESNSIKETYIVRYMDLCSEYINHVDKYRSGLNKIAKEEGATGVMKLLKSPADLEDELKEFYANFDATFLHLFPNFVEQFNSLLEEDKRIIPKQGKQLNTALRIFALIRLGITDSVKIAEFLRYSVNTIYNYRVKIRNAAINNRDDFEKQVMMVGQF